MPAPEKFSREKQRALDVDVGVEIALDPNAKGGATKAHAAVNLAACWYM